MHDLSISSEASRSAANSRHVRIAAAWLARSRLAAPTRSLCCVVTEAADDSRSCRHARARRCCRSCRTACSLCRCARASLLPAVRTHRCHTCSAEPSVAGTSARRASNRVRLASRRAYATRRHWSRLREPRTPNTRTRRIRSCCQATASRTLTPRSARKECSAMRSSSCDCAIMCSAAARCAQRRTSGRKASQRPNSPRELCRAALAAMLMEASYTASRRLAAVGIGSTVISNGLPVRCCSGERRTLRR